MPENIYIPILFNESQKSMIGTEPTRYLVPVFSKQRKYIVIQAFREHRGIIPVFLHTGEALPPSHR